MIQPPESHIPVISCRLLKLVQMGAIAEINGSRITSEFSSVDKIFLGSLSKLNDQQKLIPRCRLEYVLSDL